MTTGPSAALTHRQRSSTPRDRSGQHPERHLIGFGGILQADACGGYNGLSRAAGAVTPAFCWGHARRGFFELADLARNARRGKNAAVISPIALEAVRRIDALFAIERGLNGLSAVERLEGRRRESAPLVADLEAWLREQRSRLSRSSAGAEPIDYMLRRWPAFARFLDDGRICLSNNAAERALRGFALGRRSWLFAGSERGAERVAAIATLIITAKLNDVDPQARLADVLTPIRRPSRPAARRTAPLALASYCDRSARSRRLRSARLPPRSPRGPGRMDTGIRTSPAAICSSAFQEADALARTLPAENSYPHLTPRPEDDGPLVRSNHIGEE